ncbi:MAG: 4'-phosphopantetheinyl transferase [uncultured bacterium]|nr:MAG: 4'-phosphopantetheinyl transferase [uncultured bacterium]OGJ47086.1 MAG: holo-[acyl-carrier-protein] synthase [Candidatus Peregrinibacteria bacterium RIFOXYA2_FULL_41_18]OGJ48764.1 MAG: holo-[acyl-carrier-protein] synthase [Candidatus Peregrinibacteria bacterium RIFOXYB12_FULL_41_12]OGJ52435.1 MAG: holo-[acyl-carrier-protein] synthase [Candidatus Peregrinibacteria bacterium RIFOXYB2_FULL_41_88]OGJ53110.1 MAG: holo-[acyl-carrier-protein] synthase [Candidatus Peregrinibacteria bacterium R
MEIGIDCVDICRFKGIEKNKRLLAKIFTKKEVEYCISRRSHAQHFAVRFAAKEAVLKALMCYGESVPFNKIEIINGTNGKPEVNLIGRKHKFKCKISLSHSREIAMAQALIIN